MTPANKRVPYGTGSIYKRSRDGRWVAVIEDGWHANGTRKRIHVTGKTEGDVRRKLRDRKAAKARGQTADTRVTVKAWANTYLEIRVADLSPKAYNAAANPIRNWVVPTIGHKRLTDLTPADIRAVAAAQRKKGRQPHDTHRVMMTMLRAAVGEGHALPATVLAAKPPAKAAPSDRAAMTDAEALAVLRVAADLPHGSRWLVAMVYGMRLNECLGLTWDAVDFTAGSHGEIVIEWQLQALPYNISRDRTSGFRIPDGYEARHLVDAFHLVRPKTRAGYRVAPLLAPVADALRAWRDHSPTNPHGLVWPNLRGRPANDKNDREEWWAIQATAGVSHPVRMRTDEATGERVPAYFHIHECRNFAATTLLDAGVDEHVITDLLGHSTLAASLRYRTRRREPLREAMEKVAERLQLG